MTKTQIITIDLPTNMLDTFKLEAQKRSITVEALIIEFLTEQIEKLKK